MSKVYVVLIGSNDGVYGGYVDSRAGQEMVGPIMNALFEIKKWVRAEGMAASMEDADVVLVIVLTCPCCDGTVASRINELQKMHKRIVVVTPLEGSDDAGVTYNFKSTMMPYFPGFIPRPETNRTCEGGIATVEECSTHIIEGVLGALARELAGIPHEAK